MKAAGAFNGRPRELGPPHNMLADIAQRLSNSQVELDCCGFSISITSPVFGSILFTGEAGPSVPTGRQIATGFSGERGSQQHLFNSLVLQRSRLTLTESLKRRGGDNERVDCSPLYLVPYRSMKPQRDVWLLAPPSDGNLLPSDLIGRTV
jgi:hypothetical protein